MAKPIIEKLWKLKKYVYRPSNKRLLFLFGILLLILAYINRPWPYDITVESEHYKAYSTATREQTGELLNVAEILYQTYTGKFSDFCRNTNTPAKLKLKIYKDRREFKSYNALSRWAEAFYKKPYCHQYYDSDSPNSYQWMVHEAVHQLNNELMGIKMKKWLDEGIGEYFSTSTIKNNQLKLGVIDLNTYPIWWLSEMDLTGDMQADIKNKKFIPLKKIITDIIGPVTTGSVNKYYIHWWSLTHFLFHYENGKYAPKLNNLIRDGGTLESFQSNIGPLDQIQQQWHQYLYKKEFYNIKECNK